VPEGSDEVNMQGGWAYTATVKDGAVEDVATTRAAEDAVWFLLACRSDGRLTVSFIHSEHFPFPLKPVSLILVGLAVAAVRGNDHNHGASATRNTAGAGMSDAPRRLSDGTVFVAKTTQRLLEVRTAAAKPETVRAAVNLIGRVIGDPNRTSVVQSIHGGRVIPLRTRFPCLRCRTTELSPARS
jgi:hypothetical protein